MQQVATTMYPVAPATIAVLPLPAFSENASEDIVVICNDRRHRRNIILVVV